MHRRRFLIAALAGSGAWIAGCSAPSRLQLRHAGAPGASAAGRLALNGWVRVGRDGRVGVVLARSEMGQGIHTALLMLVAEELGCGMDQLQGEPATIDPVYGNVVGLAEAVPYRADDEGTAARSLRWIYRRVLGRMGFMMTGGSSSLRDLWLPMREAAAMTRATLEAAAAASWQLPADAVSSRDGRLHARDGRSMGLGDAVALLGADPKPATQFSLRRVEDFRLLGRPLARIDAAAMADGTARYAIDVREPGMLHAALRMAPRFGARLRGMDDAAARAMPGVRGVLALPLAHGGAEAVAVVADGWWQARQALAALVLQWDGGPAAALSSAQVDARLRAALQPDEAPDAGRGHVFWRAGDADRVFADATTTLRADYATPYLAHATLEPMNCTVRVDGNGGEARATVWAPTQVPDFARRAAALALGLPEDRVQMHVPPLGGGFGRRLEVDFVAQAARLAKAHPGRAVKLVWSREDDTRHDFYRPATRARLSAGLDAQGRITAWRHASAGQAIVPAYFPRASGWPFYGPDKTAAEGAFDLPYEFTAVRVSHARVALPVPVGFWRSVGHSHHAFFTECFLDECAHAARADPLAYRLALLERHPRHRAVLELAASRAGWGTPLPAGTARGIALHASFGSIVAQVAEVTLDEGRIRVARVVCAIDCGFAVNPALIEQQMEGGIAFGLSAALFGRIDIDAGAVVQGNFHDCRVLRMDEMPEVGVHIVPSLAPPGGAGEPGVPPVAPAVANALFALTGRRVRELPLAPGPQ